MAKSRRGRRPRRPSCTSRDPRPVLTDTDRAALVAVADAEARGDIEEAAALASSVLLLAGSLHADRLRQLAWLGDEAPGWMWSRWMTLQVRRPVWSDAPERSLGTPEFGRTIEVAYPDGVPVDRMNGWPPEIFVPTMFERDWVLRQLTVYDSGALADFVAHRAGERLLRRADAPAEWAVAPMGGYRLDARWNGTLRVMDLATGERHDVLDLGAAYGQPLGQHVLGRLVPTSTGPGTMFEWRPLPVDVRTAQRVADAPDAWTDVVGEHAREGLLPDMFSLMDDDTEFLADLPLHTWLAGVDSADIEGLPQSEDGEIAWTDVAAVALERVLCASPRVVTMLTDIRPALWALVLRPDLEPHIRTHLSGPAFDPGWRALASLLPEPARTVCLRYAEPFPTQWAG